MNEKLSILIDTQKSVIEILIKHLNENHLLMWYDHRAKPSRGVVENYYSLAEVSQFVQQIQSV